MSLRFWRVFFQPDCWDYRELPFLDRVCRKVKDNKHVCGKCDKVVGLFKVWVKEGVLYKMGDRENKFCDRKSEQRVVPRMAECIILEFSK